MELFAEKGYEDTSMADIARRTGVVQGLCYRYLTPSGCCSGEAMEQLCSGSAVPPGAHHPRPSPHDPPATGRHGGADAGDRAERPLPRLYHRPENDIHEELNWHLRDLTRPVWPEELEDACQRGELRLGIRPWRPATSSTGRSACWGNTRCPWRERVALRFRCLPAVWSRNARQRLRERGTRVGGKNSPFE